MKELSLSIISVLFVLSGAFAQPSSDLHLQKPKKFEDKQLASEKTGEKKFGAPRRFIQNTVTHYNYYYNANTRLNEIVARAKSNFRDDYTRLLPFYNYDLESTAQFKGDLDSVIYKSTAGILLHDLRNSYIDNLYLLIGKSYYFRNELDSAYLTFQYVNYAFSPKEKDGWDKVIGSNSNEGGNVFSVSTKENSSIVNRALTQPPSRNESFIWQIRTYLAKNDLTEASGLIETLRNDPLFPERLHTDLEEMQALWFYKQNMYDSAALHLQNALGNAGSQQERARWEYLIAQLYERSGQNELAKTFYNKATTHTIDPLLEVYSIMNGLRQDGEGNEKEVKNAVDELMKMARKDKYYRYRDMVYYTAATIEEEHNHPEEAKLLLLKSVKYSMNNQQQKSRSFLALGDISYAQENYLAAKSFYDSVNVSAINPAELVSFNALKATLDKIDIQSRIIERQDSLQRIAAMPENEREQFIKTLVRQLRRQKGMKDPGGSMGSSMDASSNSKAPEDLFGSSPKGEWYFSNANLKTKGQAEFKAKWGDRPNSDNWRRSSIAAQQFIVANHSMTGGMTPNTEQTTKPAELSYETLLAKLPLTEDLKKLSLDSTEHALFQLGKTYQDGLEEYAAAITAYERLLATFPASVHAEETWFRLYYCYGKTNKPASQQEIKQILASRFPGGAFTAMLTNKTASASSEDQKKKEATDIYNGIYNLFIEGKFAEAVEKKKDADSRFPQNYWNPQLLYIEAVYHIRQRNDSTAKVALNNIIRLNPGGPLADKSKRILDILNRRKEIEDYLTKLDIKRPGEGDIPVKEEPVVVAPPVIKDTAAVVKDPSATTVKTLKAPADSAKTAVSAPKAPTNAPDKIINLPAVDTAKAIVTSPVIVPADTVKAVVIIPKADTAKTIVNVPKIIPADTAKEIVVAPKPPVRDTTRAIDKPATPVINSMYGFKPEQPHYAAFVMTKVDPVYVTEARNAFNRYNRENYASKNIQSSSLPLTDDIKIVLFQGFENAATAALYVENAQKLAVKDIIPWLKPEKYTFIIISAQNLELLKNTKDYEAYRRFLAEAYPGKGF